MTHPLLPLSGGIATQFTALMIIAAGTKRGAPEATAVSDKSDTPMFIIYGFLIVFIVIVGVLAHRDNKMIE